MVRARPLAAAALLAASCTVGPDYERPPIDSPEAWREAAAADSTLADLPWWQLLGDPALEEAIRVALEENRDLRIAVERIEEARARYGFTRAQLYPWLDATAAAGRFRFSEGTLAHLPESGTAPDEEQSLFAGGLALSWEIDFFGRIRRAAEADRAAMLATEEARRSVVLTLVSEVARVYVEMRDFDRRLEIARRTLESRREYVELARTRFEGGITPELDWRQSEAEFHRIQALVHEFERLVAQKENELSVLLGRNPSSIGRGRPVEELQVPPSVPAGLPSALLERRPDIRQAEEELASSFARIGEAKALLYPRISLTGSFGYASTELDEWLEPSSRSWSVLGGLLQPIFHAGELRRQVEVRESQQRQALLAYQGTILRAFGGVEDSLVGYRTTGEQRRALGSRVEAERKVLDLSETRYRGGVAAYLEVLDAQRSLFSAELEEVETVRDNVVSLILLYKSLGGGWSETPATAAAEPPAEGKRGP